ncbi:Uncharacterized protein APZ42_013658 [Daphnia magna]|uniref:BRCT domain-containing protein n=1 Tax=Daphnia magna TaxID=35525 RepID=A0A162QR19_9CRUS|nr:Uncharacterized protein APZ42_013658 [Daphnia magna]
MEGLHNNFTAPNPPTEVSRRSVNSNNNMDPSFVSLSFITDDDILEEFNTVNETVLDDYSQASTAALSISHGSNVSQIVSRISESPAMDNMLTSQLSSEPDSNLNLSRPSLDSPSADTAIIEDDEDVLPASPVPVNQPSCRRTPVSLSRSSAFVTMAIGSPVQGSLRTLRNIEEAASSTVPDKVDSSPEANEATAKTITNVEALGSISKSKSMRQIQFESDSGSNHSAVIESPSSFLSEPNRGFDNSIQKPTVSRPSEPPEDADDGIEFVAEVRRKVREEPSSPQSSVAIPAAQPRREADSASQHLTPRLTQSPLSVPYSQDLLSTSPFRDPDSQSHRFVECFQTQDLISRANHSPGETPQLPADISNDISSKLELSADLSPQESPSNGPKLNVDHSVPAVSTPNFPDEVKAEEKECRSSNETTQHMSSQENTPEVEQEQWVPFEAVTRIYNTLERAWVIRTFSKMLPVSKMEKALSGSVSEQVRMGLFDNMDCETLPGSRLESFAELLHRHVSQSSSGYNADVSGSYKSDSASLRMSRFSIASNFETAPIACSSMLSRASLEPPVLPVSSEFAMPKHPVRQKATRSTNAETAMPSSPNAQSKEEGTAPLPSHSSLYPDSTEGSLAVDVASGPVISGMKDKEPQRLIEQGATAYTEIKVIRKRGRKPKIPEMIKETETSSETPPKKGRRGRPPADGTPAKNKSGGTKKNQQTERTESSDNRPAANANPDQLNVDPDSLKSSDDFVTEVGDVLRDLRHSSYEINKPVFAQWTDKCFYAAKITQRDSVQTGKWTVVFEDGQSRSLVEEFILPVSLLSKNQPILVLNENLCEGRPGVVIGYSKLKPTEPDEKMEHLVEMDGCETIKVPRKRICLTQEHIRHWSDSIVVPQLFSPHTCNVSLDNILGGKRRRATTTELIAPSPQKTPRNPRTPRSRSETPAVAQDQTPKRSVSNSGSLRKKITGKRDLTLDTSTMSESSGASFLQHEETSLRSRILDRMHSTLVGRTTVQNVVEEEIIGETKEEVNFDIAGPIPENNQLFAGFAFLLTKATRPLEVDPDEVTDEVEPYINPTPYYKEHIKRQLTAGGGRVLERFDLSQLEMDEGTVLIVCNRPCRTERYIRSLAANIRAVSHDWVYQCCQKNERFNYERYLHPPGIDLHGNIVEWSPTTGRCFVGMRVLLHGPPEFNDLWVPILVQAECIIVSRLPARACRPDSEEANVDIGAADSEKALCDDVPFDYVVTTKDCPTKIVDQARRMKIPLVSSMWVIQSLIQGKILDPSSSHEFNFNYTKP